MRLAKSTQYASMAVWKIEQDMKREGNLKRKYEAKIGQRGMSKEEFKRKMIGDSKYD